MITKKTKTIDEQIAAAEEKAKAAKKRALELKKKKEQKAFEDVMAVVREKFPEVPSEKEAIEKYFDDLIMYAEYGKKVSTENKKRKQEELQRIAQSQGGQK